MWDNLVMFSMPATLTAHDAACFVANSSASLVHLAAGCCLHHMFQVMPRPAAARLHADCNIPLGGLCVTTGQHLSIDAGVRECLKGFEVQQWGVLRPCQLELRLHLVAPCDCCCLHLQPGLCTCAMSSTTEFIAG
jgi:hypothetical protein